jgi:hypothetical protein
VTLSSDPWAPRQPTAVFLAAALALALLAPFASLPPFALGYWEKAEFLVIWLHLTAAVAAIAFALRIVAHPDDARHALHPLVLLPALLAVYGLVMTPVVESPWLNLSGAPQSGFGVLWFLDLAVFVAAGLAVRDHLGPWDVLLEAMIAVILAVAAVKAIDWQRDLQGAPSLLIWVASYYGWLALPLVAILFTADRRRRYGPWLVTAGMLAAAAVAAVSRSITPAAVAAAAALFGLAAGWIRPRLPRLGSFFATRAFAVAAVAGAAFLPLLVLWTWPGVQAHESLRDRLLVQKMILAALSQDTLAAALGHGWGRTQDAFQVFLNVSGERLWQSDWIFLSSDYFHSHNWIMETVHAAGPFGVFLVLAGWLAIPLTAGTLNRPVATAFAAGLAALNGLWFQLPLSVPFMALAMAAATRSLRFTASAGLARSVGVVFACAALLQIGVAGRLAVSGIDVSALRRSIAAGLPPDRPLADFRGSDLAFAEVFRDFFEAYGKETDLARQQALRPVALALIGQIETRIPDTRTPFLPMTGVGVLDAVFLAHTMKPLEADLAPRRDLWRQWVDRSLALAPGRSDVAIGYLAAEVSDGHADTVRQFSDSLLGRQPDDPVGLYFLGIVEAISPDAATKEAGKDLLRRSVGAGIERFMPVDPALRRLIGMPTVRRDRHE